MDWECGGAAWLSCDVAARRGSFLKAEHPEPRAPQRRTPKPKSPCTWTPKVGQINSAEFVTRAKIVLDTFGASGSLNPKPQTLNPKLVKELRDAKPCQA